MRTDRDARTLSDAQYFERRAGEEAAAARSCTTPDAGERHLRLARLLASQAEGPLPDVGHDRADGAPLGSGFVVLPRR